jgi:transposase
MKEAYLGLDVHKSSISIAVARAGNEPSIHYGKCGSDIDTLLRALGKLLKKYGLKREEVALCYEAGPCGFALARHLLRLGWTVEVIAPSKTPQRPGDRVKTDPIDAAKLAGWYRAGKLKAVHLPDPEDEVIRDLCRARTDAVEERMRGRQKLRAFLLRNGHGYTGKSGWTEPHLRYLRELVLPDPVQKQILEDYLQAIDGAEQRVGRLEAQMRLHLEHWSRRPFVEALQGLRGFQLVAAMVVTSELGDLGRFERPPQLAAYLGLIPGEDSSGDRRRQGPITKCGNSHVRWMLVEVAQHYRLAPKVSHFLSRRQEGLSQEIKAVSWKAQNRLHRRYVKLAMRRLHHNKIIVALARELTGFIWELDRVMPR